MEGLCIVGVGVVVGFSVGVSVFCIVPEHKVGDGDGVGQLVLEVGHLEG